MSWLGSPGTPNAVVPHLQLRFAAPSGSEQVSTARGAALDPAEREAEQIGARIGSEITPMGEIGSGALPEPARRVAEQHLGVDLGETTLAFDGAARASVRSVGAHAVTQGNTVKFARGQLSTASGWERALLGHELVHVAQQQAHGVGSAPPAQYALPVWTTGAGGVQVDSAAAAQIKTGGGLFSGQDQAHVNVSTNGKLAYDSSYTTPEDPFRWSKLKALVDAAHVQIFAVARAHPFDVVEAGKTVQRSINEIAMMVGDLSVMGITLRIGMDSPDPVFDRIYYDAQSGLAALSHELFGHESLAAMGAPFRHPMAGTPAERTIGTITPSNAVKDPFGNVFAGTVRSYIAKYVEPPATKIKVTTQGGLPGATRVPASPTQGVSSAAVLDAFNALYTNATSGMTARSYSAAIAQAWRSLCNNYDLMPMNQEAQRAGNTDLTYTKEVIVALCLTLFNLWTKDQQAGFRILLADYTGSRAGFSSNELSEKLEQLVGAAPNIFLPARP